MNDSVFKIHLSMNKINYTVNPIIIIDPLNKILHSPLWVSQFSETLWYHKWRLYVSQQHCKLFKMRIVIHQGIERLVRCLHQNVRYIFNDSNYPSTQQRQNKTTETADIGQNSRNSRHMKNIRNNRYRTKQQRQHIQNKTTETTDTGQNNRDNRHRRKQLREQIQDKTTETTDPGQNNWHGT